jgi:hypothetical protein
MAIENLGCLISPVILILSKLFKNVKCPQVVAVVVPRFGGKSNFIQSVSSNDYLLLDLEENVKMMMSDNEKAQLESLQGSNSFNLHYFPLVNKYLKSVIADHPNKNILVFVSSLDLAKYCGIKTIQAFVPSSSLCDSIKGSLAGDVQRLFDASKNDLLVKLKPKQLNVYNSWTQLNELISDKFHLTSRL